MEYIVDYKKRLERSLENLDKRNISKFNKDVIFRFMGDKSMELSHARLSKYAEKLPRMAEEINKDFNKITIDDLKNYLYKIHQKDYSIHIKFDFNILIKAFCKWFYNEDEHPKLVEWIKTKFDTKRAK